VYGSIKTRAGLLIWRVLQTEGCVSPVSSTGSESTVALHNDQNHAIEEKGETILLVDDEENLRSTTTEVPNSLDYKVLKRKSQRALGTFKQQHKHIKLLPSTIAID